MDIDRREIGKKIIKMLTNVPSDRGLAGVRAVPALPGERLLLRPGEPAVPAGEGGQDGLC